MKKSIVAAVFAAAGLIAAASGNAFAGLVATGGYDLPDSFARTFTASTSGALDVLPSFTRFEVTVLPNVSFIATAGAVGQTFNITNRQPLEDIVSHDAIDTFIGANAGWAQTNPGVGLTPGNILFASAAGNSVSSPALGFSLNFAGETSDGAHVRIDFYDGNTYRTSYEYKFKRGSTTDGSAFGTEIVNTSIPLPPAVWSGLAMMAGLGVFLAKRRNDRKILS